MSITPITSGSEVQVSSSRTFSVDINLNEDFLSFLNIAVVDKNVGNNFNRLELIGEAIYETVYSDEIAVYGDGNLLYRGVPFIIHRLWDVNIDPDTQEISVPDNVTNYRILPQVRWKFNVGGDTHTGALLKRTGDILKIGELQKVYNGVGEWIDYKDYYTRSTIQDLDIGDLVDYRELAEYESWYEICWKVNEDGHNWAMGFTQDEFTSEGDQYLIEPNLSGFMSYDSDDLYDTINIKRNNPTPEQIINLCRHPNFASSEDNIFFKMSLDSDEKEKYKLFVKRAIKKTVKAVADESKEFVSYDDYYTKYQPNPPSSTWKYQESSKTHVLTPYYTYKTERELATNSTLLITIKKPQQYNEIRTDKT